MKVEIREDREIWILNSGWRVSPDDSLFFVAPDGVIYDRCYWLLCSRSNLPSRFPRSVQLADIFTDEEFERYTAAFQ